MAPMADLSSSSSNINKNTTTSNNSSSSKGLRMVISKKHDAAPSTSCSASSTSAVCNSSISSPSPLPSPSPSPSPLVALQEILNSIANQRNQILSIINGIDPGFLAASSPKLMEEHKLLNQITELQVRILAVSEELHLMRAKNAQLEHQLTSFHDKRATIS